MVKNIILALVFSALSVRAQSVFTEVKRTINVANYERCNVILDSCLHKNYQRDSTLYYKTLVNLKTGKIKEARKTCNALQKSYAEFGELHYLQGLVYFSEEDYGKCIDEFNAALKITPNNIKIIYNRSLAFGMLEEYLAAIEDLSACIALNQHYALAYYSRAYWYEYTGNYTEAAKDYETTIRFNPQNYDAYFGLANAYKKLGDAAKACETISRAVKAGSQIADDLKGTFCE